MATADHERMVAMLVARGLLPSVAAGVAALYRVDEEGLFAERSPKSGCGPAWTVGTLPREYATEGEGDSLAEALAHHDRLIAEVARG